MTDRVKAIEAFEKVMREVEETERTNTRNAGTDYCCRMWFVEHGRAALSPSTAPGIWGAPKCATEGCPGAAEVYFESGGVGSTHCPACIAKIAALGAPDMREAVEALTPLARLPIGQEIIEDRDLVLYANAGRSITVGDVLDARAALRSLTGDKP